MFKGFLQLSPSCSTTDVSTLRDGGFAQEKQLVVGFAGLPETPSFFLFQYNSNHGFGLGLALNSSSCYDAGHGKYMLD